MALSSNPEVLQAKSELAEKYLEDLKKELGVLQKWVVTIVEKRLKTYMLQDAELPQSLKDFSLTRWEKFLISLSPTTAEKVFQFLKEKQKLILQTTTVEELNNLKNWILLSTNTKQENSVMKNPEEENAEIDAQTASDESNNPVNKNDVVKNDKKNETWNVKIEQKKWNQENSAIVDVWVMWAWGILEWAQKIKNDWLKWSKMEWANGVKAEKLAEKLWVTDTKKMLDNIKNVLESRKSDPALLPKQRKEIQKVCKIFEDASKNVWSLDNLKIWKKLVKSNVLTADIFDVLKISEWASADLLKIAQNPTLMKQLAWTEDITKIKTLLSKNKITSLSDETLQILQKTKTPEEISDVIKVLSKQKELTTLAKAAKSIPILDIVVYWLEVKNFWWQEKNARNISHFTVNTIIYWWTAAWWLAALTPLVASWPAWWVVLAWVWVAESANYAMDACYFDVKDFYEQKKDDFIKQSRTEIKQAIVQATAWSTWSNVSVNEDIYNALPGWPGKEWKMKTVENAMWGLLYTEEVLKYPTVWAIDTNWSYKTLSPEKKVEYDEQKKLLDEIIEKRMQYVKHFMPQWDRYLEFSNAIKQWKSLEFVQKIAADSEVYLQMTENWVSSDKSIDTYKNEYKNTLEAKNPQLFKQIDTYIKKHPEQTGEFFASIIACANETWHDQDATSDEFEDDAVMKPIVDFANEYMNWFYMWKSFEDKPQLSESSYDVDFVKMHQMLKDMADGKEVIISTTQYEEIDMKRRLVHELDQTDRFQDVLEVSPDIRQNIIYRIAKEFHGYNGWNNMANLKEYFAEWNGDKKKWLYYEEWGLDNNDGRRMNTDRGIDARLNFWKIEQETPEELMLKWFDIIIWKDWKQFLFDKWAWIDSETETTDENINQEFFKKIYTILKEEKENHSEKNKNAVIKETQEYIKNNATTWYVKLPYYLVMKIAKAWLWNALYRYFSASWWKITAVTTNEYISIPMNIPWIEKQYVENKDWENKTLTVDEIIALSLKSLSGWEKKTVAAVDKATDRILKTVWALTRSDQRWEVKYDTMKKVLASRWWETSIEEKNGKWIVAKWDINIEYNSVEEACYVANMVNWMRKYKKEHPSLELSYYNWWLWNFGRWKWLYDVNTWFRWTDTRLISQSEINSKFDQTFSSTNYKTFMNFIEHKLI